MISHLEGHAPLLCPPPQSIVLGFHLSLLFLLPIVYFATPWKPMQPHVNTMYDRKSIIDWFSGKRQEFDSWLFYFRQKLKSIFNPYFGSVFRTYNNPTYFSRRLTRYADIYTAKLPNLLHYPLTYTFYPRRNHLPHEHDIN